MQEHKTLRWWRLLAGIATLNIGLWVVTAVRHDSAQGPVLAHLALSGIYTAVCAFRSFWPRIDLERTALWDSPLSSMALGRTGATLAEVCFAGQIALLMAELGSRAEVPWVVATAPAIVVLLSLAQAFCWSSVISLSHLGHAIEESIWGLTFTGVAVGLVACIPGLSGPWWTAAVGGCVFAVLYVVFMVTVDVPMYLRRWRASVAAGERRLGLVEGLRDAVHRREVTRSWAVWRPEVAWLTGYFSGAVWLSLGMVWLSATG